ncbi:MAG: hypothetical protein D6732_06660 [Methanobacteriota archaeon]|nr:MAG: hypothetical protein D6732_06660 [Euryarchaeota archaeon]
MGAQYSPPKHRILLICISLILAALFLFFMNSIFIVIALVTGSYTLIYIESLKFLLDKYQKNEITKRTMNLASFMIGLPILFPIAYLLITRPELT